MSMALFTLPVAQELSQVENAIARETQSDIPFINTVVQYAIQNGGKRLRPLLTLLSAKLSGYSGDGAIQLGAALEMIHTATLLHDDVVDDAQLRRGKSSVKAKWGNQVGVLLGDFFWSKASELIVRQGNLRVL